MTSLVTLRHVGMRYRRRAAPGEDAYAVFDDINLELHRGERLGVVGRNGAGKSTLLRIMAKIFAPFSGEVVWAPDTKVSLLSLGLGFLHCPLGLPLHPSGVPLKTHKAKY